MDKDTMKGIIEKYVDDMYQEAFFSVLAKYVAAEVVKRYNSRTIKTAAFFTGALLDVDLAIAALAELQGNGYEICAILSKPAGELIGVDKLKAALKTEAVYIEAQAPAAEWQQAELILVPTLTVNTAAKIACGISDSYVADSISKCIMMGKPIISTIEGACPVCKQRLDKYKGKIPQAYAEVLSANLAKMRAYGIELCYSKNLGKKVEDVAAEKLRNLAGAFAAPAAAAPVQSSSRYHGVRVAKRLVGVGDVANLPAGTTVSVVKDAIVTDLARDAIKKNSIHLIYE